MSTVLYTYRPETVKALALLLMDDAEKRAKQAYIGNTLWGILQSLSMGKSKLKSFSEVFTHKKEDPRTAEDIVQQILRWAQSGADQGGKGSDDA